MVDVKSTCISCKKRISNDTGSARFPCPRCGKIEIIRCKNCRVNAIKYKCYSCNFEGPN